MAFLVSDKVTTVNGVKLNEKIIPTQCKEEERQLLGGYSSIEDALGYLPESPTQVQTKIDSSLNAHKNNYVDPHMYLDEESGWTDVKYRLVMIEGKAFMEVVEVEVGGGLK